MDDVAVLVRFGWFGIRIGRPQNITFDEPVKQDGVDDHHDDHGSREKNKVLLRHSKILVHHAVDNPTVGEEATDDEGNEIKIDVGSVEPMVEW